MPRIEEVKVPQPTFLKKINPKKKKKKINPENEDMWVLPQDELHSFDFYKFIRNLRLSQILGQILLCTGIPMKPVTSYPSCLKKYNI